MIPVIASKVINAGLICTGQSAIGNVFQVCRGGAVAATTSAVSSVANAMLSRGGVDQGSMHADGDVQILGLSISPRGRAVLFMAIGMALHYFGYSLARPTTIALFTSARSGYGQSHSAFPLANAFVSPMSLILLMGYTRVLKAFGPKGALTRTTTFCAAVIALAAAAIVFLDDSGLSLLSVPIVKLISGPLFVFRESYVQLLTSQYWSFLASTLTPAQSAVWFAPISGLTSISSAAAGVAMSRIVDSVGLPGTLFGTSLGLLASLFAIGHAYSIAERNGFAPDGQKEKSKDHAKSSPKSSTSFFVQSVNLFKRVPVLGALFVEILASQGLVTLLNVCFVAKLSASIPDDSERAGWVGMFFAAINVLSMTLQFAVLPPLMRVIEPRQLWRAVPLIAMCFTSFQAVQKDPSLYIVSASLLVMKAIEYSARRMLDEMVFVPLDFESRYVGKEVIGIFGYRFGKSIMSLMLSGITSVFGNLAIQPLSILTNGVSFVWLATAWRLSNLVPTRKEAEDSYQSQKASVTIK